MTATEEVLAIFARIDTEGEKMALDAQEFYSNFSKEFEFEMKGGAEIFSQPTPS